MMSAAECTAKADSLVESARALAPGALRSELESTAREWIALAVTARAQMQLQEQLLRHMRH